jgi:hypothetical protein
MTGKLNIVGAGYALDAVTGRATVTARTTYLALLTAAPTPSSSTLSTISEYDGVGYSRQVVFWNSDPAVTPRVIGCTNGAHFGPITAGTGATITHWAVVSAGSGITGDVLAQGDWATPRTPEVGDSLTVAPAAVNIQID